LANVSSSFYYLPRLQKFLYVNGFSRESYLQSRHLDNTLFWDKVLGVLGGELEMLGPKDIHHRTSGCSYTVLLAAGISASRILHLQGNNKSGIRNLQMVCPIEINVDCKLQCGSGIDLKCYWVI
jgi:hypothetical protein